MLNKKEIKVKNIINKLTCATKEQLIILANLESNTEKKVIDLLVSKKILKKELINGQEVYVNFYNQPDIKIVKCNEILCYFNKQVKWYSVEMYPYTLIMSLNKKIFDIVYVEKGDESLINSMFNKLLNPVTENSPAPPESLIIVLEDENMINKMNINSDNVLYCSVDPIKFLNIK